MVSGTRGSLTTEGGKERCRGDDEDDDDEVGGRDGVVVVVSWDAAGAPRDDDVGR